MKRHWLIQGPARHALTHACRVGVALCLSGCLAGTEENFVVGTPDAAEAVGERLFLETRFAPFPPSTSHN